MDEAKRRELEELKKQIDPKVLERVAKAMGGGGGGGGASAPSPSTTSAPSRSSSGVPKGGSMSDLKARIARRERELNIRDDEFVDDNDPTPKEADPKFAKPERHGHDKGFVIYDVNMLRGRQILAYFQKMTYFNASVTGDPNRFIEAFLHTLNNAEIIYPVVVCHAELYPVVNAILSSEQFNIMKKQIRDLDNIATFIMYDDDQDLARVPDVDSRYLLSYRHNPEFTRERIHQVLDVLHDSGL